MLLHAQKIIDDGLRAIVEEVLTRSPWDPSFGLTPDTGESELEYAVEVLNAIVKSAISLRNDQSRHRNRMVAPINHLPPELLSCIWKHAISRNTDYHLALNRIRHTSSYWADVVREDPSFWTVLNCDDPLDLVEISLERSKALPLQVYFPCTDVPLSAEEREEDDYVRRSHDHYDFLHLLIKHLPSRSISQLHFQPYEDDWDGLAELVATPAPVLSVLIIKHEPRRSYNQSSIDMRGLVLCAGVAPDLQILELTLCDLPTSYPPLPGLLSCTVRECNLSRHDLFRLVSAAPALRNLSITACTATRTDESPSFTILHTNIRHLCMENNTIKDNGENNGLVSVLDYFQAPYLESFDVRMGVEGTKPRIAEWISAFSERHAINEISALDISLVPSFFDDSYVIYMALGPNFRLRITQSRRSTETPDSVIRELLDGIHLSAYASITFLELGLSQPFVDHFLPTLVLKFTATTELKVPCDAHQSWVLLGQRRDNGEWPFPHLTTLWIDQLSLMNGAETPLLDMLRARKEIVDGMKTIYFNSGQVCQAFSSAAQGLGVTVQNGRVHPFM